MTASAATVHVATDWPAFGLFFLALISTFGGFCAWILRRLDRSRTDWKAFVTQEIQEVKRDLQTQFTILAKTVDDNTSETRDQGKAIARIEGRLGTVPAVQPPDRGTL